MVHAAPHEITLVPVGRDQHRARRLEGSLIVPLVKSVIMGGSISCRHVNARPKPIFNDPEPPQSSSRPAGP